jgi:hypothetical protein
VWLICLIRSSFSVTATVNVVYVCDLSFLEADMFLVLIQAMGGWGITFLGQLYRLHFLLAVSHKSVSLYYVLLLILQFFSIICLIHAQQTYENPWFIFPPKNEWRILFAMMIILIMNGLHPAVLLLPFLIPRCLLNTNFYCDPHSGGYPLGNLLESVQ